MAARFSYEQRHPGKSTFGFHGQSNFFRHENDDAVLAIYHRLPESALMSLNGFGLIVTSLRAERHDLALALYRRLRGTADPAAILRALSREVPAEIVRQTIARWNRVSGATSGDAHWCPPWEWPMPALASCSFGSHSMCRQTGALL